MRTIFLCAQKKAICILFVAPDAYWPRICTVENLICRPSHVTFAWYKFGCYNTCNDVPYRQAASMSSLLLPSLSPRKKAPTDPARAPNRELLTTRPDLKGLRLYLHSRTHTEPSVSCTHAHMHTQHAQCHAHTHTHARTKCSVSCMPSLCYNATAQP